jgi:hypothetical protein
MSYHYIEMDGRFHVCSRSYGEVESTWDNREHAAARVSYLNGGEPFPPRAPADKQVSDALGQVYHYDFDAEPPEVAVDMEEAFIQGWKEAVSTISKVLVLPINKP